MSHFTSLSIDHPISKLTDLFGKRWFLLVAGNFKEGKYNAMTVSWGTMGVMWGKPVAMVMSRPQRFTNEFLKKYPDFTLCGFSDDKKKGLTLCGSISGKTNPNKLKDAGFTPIEIEGINAPGIAEADIIIGCKIVYKDDMKGDQLDLELAEQWYPQKDFHTLYFGEMKVLLEK